MNMSEGKKGLVAYIAQQAGNIDSWERWRDFLIHKPSRIGILTERRLWWVNVTLAVFPSDRYYFDDNKKLEVGFTMIQKWKVHRKLNKLRQQMRKRQRDAAAQEALEKMIAGVWGGENTK